VAEALGRWVAAVADTKFFLGRRLAEWCVGAPELESAVACAAVAQEELGHARVLYPLLAELPLRTPLVPLERELDRAQVLCPEFCRKPWQTWPEAVVGLAAVDTALTVALRCATTSAHEELARRAARIVEEERFHAVFAWGRVRALSRASSADATRSVLASRIPEVCRWMEDVFGGCGVLKAAGLVDADCAELCGRFTAAARAQLDRAHADLAELVGVGSKPV
jgi:1,2-phenylacetyl-CoA epoxidase catalytic subunit